MTPPSEKEVRGGCLMLQPMESVPMTVWMKFTKQRRVARRCVVWKYVCLTCIPDPIYYSLQVGVDDFDMIKVIGKGSFGKVTLVRKKSDGKLFAMKVRFVFVWVWTVNRFVLWACF